MVDELVCDSAIGDVCLDLAGELKEKGREDLSRFLAVTGYGFYRQSEDVEGMGRCKEYLKTNYERQVGVDSLCLKLSRYLVPFLSDFFDDEREVKKIIRSALVSILSDEEGVGDLFEN